MPLYEGIGLINEKPAVVIDIGQAFTKVGFAGEVAPHAIIPSAVECRRSRATKPLRSFMTSELLLQEALIDFFQMLYEKMLLVNSKERPVVILEDLMGSTTFRQVLAKVLYTFFDVPCIAAVPGHIVASFPLGAYTAFVVDVGHEETTVLPVCQGIPLVKCWSSCKLASTAVNARLKEELLTNGKLVLTSEEELPLKDASFELDDRVIEDIKGKISTKMSVIVYSGRYPPILTSRFFPCQVRACFVTPASRATSRSNKTIEKECEDLIYPHTVDGVTHSVRVPGHARETAAEVFFQPDEDLVTVQSMIVESILKCPVDLRTTMVENIVIAGGAAAMRGFTKRLLQELHREVENRPPYKEKLCTSNFQVFDIPTPTNSLFWFGGSVLGSTPQLAVQAVTRDTYLASRTFPDWCDLRYDGLPDSRKFVKA